MMGGSFAQDIFGGVMGQGLTNADRRSLARQMSQRQAQAFNQALANEAAPIVSTGPGLLPKDLIPDLETAADIPARIARMVETLIESRKPAPSTARTQLGFNQMGGMRWGTASTSVMPQSSFITTIEF